LTITPAALAFGSQTVNTSKTQTLTIKNDGQGPLAGSVGTLAAPFTVRSGGGKVTLAAGKAQSVGVEFRPAQKKAFSASLAITSDDPKRKSASVAVSGTGK